MSSLKITDKCYKISTNLGFKLEINLIDWSLMLNLILKQILEIVEAMGIFESYLGI